MTTEYEKWIIERGVFTRASYRHGSPSMTYDWFREHGLRDEAIDRFSFAILDSATVTALLPYGPFLEIGAGTGYWAYELRKADADIIATDPEPYSDNARTPRGPSASSMASHPWFDVEPIDAITAIDRYGAGRTLLMCWPSLNAPWPADAIAHFATRGGQRLVYVGEGDGGCTADDRFHALLESDWEEIESIDIPQWFGINDWLRVYTRKVAT